jgi:hypothetical protein
MTDKLMADIKGDPNRWILNTTNNQVMSWNPARSKNMRYRTDWVECDENGLPLKTREADNAIDALKLKLLEAEKQLAAYRTIAESKGEDVSPPEPSDVDDVDDIQTVEEVGDRRQNILNAIQKLVDNGDPDAFTGLGLPHVKMIEALTGFDITAGERDKLWADFKAQQK